MGMGGCNVLLLAFFPFFFSTSYAVNWKLFREYIGAESDSIKLADVPINPEIDHHFILAFAVDYTTDNHRPSPTDGQFNVFWDTTHLGPSQIAAIKDSHPNVKVAVSLGGDSIGHGVAYFAPESPDSWVRNAVSSLTSIIKTYNLDGIDVDYEHFKNSNPEIFAECIGKLVTELKNSGAISFASIAPFDDDGEVQSHYAALWRNYGNVIDYVNFQFYAYDKMGVSEFVRRFEEQGSKYGGGRILASFQSGGGGGLGPDDGFLEACKVLEGKGKLGGIFVWCADESAANGFKYEKASQDFLASA